MPDEVNANTEGSATPSPDNVGATGAGGESAAGGQVESTQGQTAPVSPAEELSAGWTFEDQPDPANAIPDSDDDLQGMMNDPGLNPEATPGLVEAIKTARAEARQFKAELKELRDNSAKLDQYGGYEQIEQTMSIVNGLLHTPETGALQFLQAVARDAEPAYWAMIDNLVQHAPDNLVAALQKAGKIPDTQHATAAGQLTADDWARIPQELREHAKQVPINQLIEWLDKGTDESLIYNLQREAKLSQLDSQQRNQAEQSWRQARQEAETQGKAAVDQIADQYEKAHLAQLAKWQPFGPEAGEQNQLLYRSILEGAHATLLADPQWRDTYQRAVDALQNAPMRKLNNEHFAAASDERDAKAAAMRYNARLGQVMRSQIQMLDSIFRDARAYRESQRSEIPQRTEISGMSTQAGANGAPATLTKDGKINPAYLDHMIAGLPGQSARQG